MKKKIDNRMKKYSILIWIVFLGLFINCSNDDNGGGGDPNPGTPNIDRSANLLATGASANDLLSNTNFTKLRIEVAHVPGFRPTQVAMDEFLSFIRARTFKEDIEVVFNEIPSPGNETLTLQQIADLEIENRTAYNDGDTLAIYIFFADAPSDDDEEDAGLVTLGAVYRNTSMIIFESTIRTLAARSSLITNADVESATLNHEFGHLFGLVNLGSPAVNDHEDADAENHCNVNPCLMRAELEFGGGMMAMLEDMASKGLAAPALDPECILDLQANGGR